MLLVRLLNCLAVLAITIAAVRPLGSSHREQQQLEDLEERGRAAFRQGHYGEALDTLEALVAREPFYHYSKGVALSSLLDHGVAVDGLDPQLRMNLALAVEGLGKVEAVEAKREVARRFEARGKPRKQ